MNAMNTPAISAEIKEIAEHNEILQEIADVNFQFTHEAAKIHWNATNSYAYTAEYEYQQGDIQTFINFADLKEG